MQLPTPHTSTSPLFAGLKDLVQERIAESKCNQNPTGPATGRQSRFSNISPDEPRDFIQNSNIPIAQRLFQSPKSFSRVRRSLSSVLSAKSFVYGTTFFGPKNYYSDEFDFTKEPLHPAHRRKIRFGLKSIVDFITQLDVENLKSYLNEPDAAVEKFQE